MSASRANAGAKNRRAGGAGIDVRPPQQQEPPQAPRKLSISDAIGLITLRLGRVENVVQHLQTDLPKSEATSLATPTNYVDQSAFTAITKRLEALEQKQKTAIVLAPTPAPTPAPIPFSLPENLVTRETVEKLEKELHDVKELLLKLQSFTMDVNGKLVSALFDNSNKAKEEEEEEDQQQQYGEQDNIQMSHMFGNQFDLGSFLQAISRQHQPNEETEKIIELSGPNITDEFNSHEIEELHD